MKVLDLFSGIGGFSLGLEWAGMETVAFCEYDEEAQKVLKKNWPDVPIFSDVKTLSKKDLHDNGIHNIGLICGGYPCQPFSLAGERRGSDDDRHLWPEMFRLIKELRPNWVIGENVAGHINMGLDEVLTDLETARYTARPFVIPACAVDAHHRRDRVWIIAHANSDSESNGSQHEQWMVENSSGESRGNSKGFVRGQDYKTKRSQNTNQIAGSSKNVADSYRPQRERDSSTVRTQSQYTNSCGSSWWKPESGVGRVANGVPRRSHRLKQLGNAVVPQVVEQIGKAIWRIENATN